MKALADALAVRLNMQIAVSSLPVVEEWMDTTMSRWLESIPTPMEMPGGSEAHFRVGIASDLSRLTWSGFGTPAGFVPKLAEYLGKSGADTADLAVINAIGETFEPAAVGSWISVAAGKLKTGWQFIDRLALDEVAQHLGDASGLDAVVAWARDNQITDVLSVSGTLKREGTALELDLSNSSNPCAVAKAGLIELGGADAEVATCLDLYADKGANSLRLQIGPQGIESADVRIWGLGSDSVSAIASAVGVAFNNNLLPLQGALGGTVDAVSFGVAGQERRVDALLTPASKSPDVHN